MSVALSANPAFAQNADAVVTAADEVAEEAASTQADTIFVTGSRIRRDEFSSPNPVTIVSPELSRASGQVSTAEMLQSSPIAAGSSQITSAISAAFVTDGGIGAETVSLRGLGANRTLVLINGRRAGPSGTRGGVSAFDLNTLPQSIIDSVEILKTGASSIYGSDAVAGVVNLITKRETDGVEFDAFISAPFDGGGEQYRTSATWGTTFDRGHLLISADYYRQNALRRADRTYLDCAEEYVFDTSGNRADIIDPRTGSPRCNDSFWGHVWTYDSSFRRSGLYQADYGDNLGSFVNQNAPANFTVPDNFYRVTFTGSYPAPSLAARRAAYGLTNAGNHPFIDNQSVIPQSDRYTAYLDGAYEVSDAIEIGTEMMYSRRKTKLDSWGQMYYLTGFTNDFTGTGFGDPFSPGWEGPYFVSPTAITDQAGAEVTVDYFRTVGWINGDLSSLLTDWNFSGYTQYSESDGTYANDIIFEDSVNLHDYRTASCVGTVTPISKRPCIDVNWLTPAFLAGQLTQAERDFLYGTDVGNTQYGQLVAELSFSGPVFTLPAGELQVAFGGAFRRDEITDTPGAQTLLGNVWGRSSAGITSGHGENLEAFAEAEIPVLNDLPLIESFTLSASGRVTNFKATRSSDGFSDTNNGNWTYSLGANWEVTDWLQFRARYGTSFRAPALYELFLANQTAFIAQREIDPCIDLAEQENPRIVANCIAGTGSVPGVPAAGLGGGGVSAEISQGGGIGFLQPETSTAKTASVIFTPQLGNGIDLSVAVDYYDIEIEGEIGTLGAGSILFGCYNSEFFPNEPLCDLFTRYPLGTATELQVNTVAATFINVNRQRNEGVDVTVELSKDFGSAGELSLLSQMNWQLRDETELFEGTLRDDNGEVGEPKWVGDFQLVWRSADENWQVFYGLDVIGSSNDEADFRRQNGLSATDQLCTTLAVYGTVCPDLTAETTFYHAMSVKRDFENFAITAGVSNIFDTAPPRVTVDGGNNLNGAVIPTVGQSPYVSQYDFYGRRAFVSLKVRY